MALFKIRYKGARMEEDFVEARDLETAEAVGTRFCALHSFTFVPGWTKPAVVANESILNTPLPGDIAEAEAPRPQPPNRRTGRTAVDAGGPTSETPGPSAAAADNTTETAPAGNPREAARARVANATHRGRIGH